MTWHAVLDADRRALDWAPGLSTPSHLTETSTATGQNIRSFTGDPPSNMAVGMYVTPGGLVYPPPSNNTAEELDARKDTIEQWILRNVPTRDFAAYARFLKPTRAEIFEAICRETFYRTLQAGILSNDVYWARMNSHAQIDYLDFDLLVNEDAWTPEIRASMRNGTAWYTVSTNTEGQYIPVADSDSPNWPPIYNHLPHGEREYAELIARVRVA